MALTNCPECKAEMSEKAEACTKCGRPSDKAVKEKRFGEAWEGIVAIVTLILLLLLYFRWI